MIADTRDRVDASFDCSVRCPTHRGHGVSVDAHEPSTGPSPRSLRGAVALRRRGDCAVMSGLTDALGVRDADQRTSCIVDTLVEAFADLMAADPAAFRAKFRKMAADPFAFYRGSDCLFYADVARLEDPWVDERTRRVWIQGD